ncbi:MAG: hypothetical protein IKL53_08320 [Lachnospiraceae bacterium]|nr:hypothetical protein [Lachnospiraceae bacterium]
MSNRLNAIDNFHSQLKVNVDTVADDEGNIVAVNDKYNMEDKVMKCKKGYEVTPQRSAAGYYMGTVDEEHCPNCRLTTCYCKTAAEAERLPLDRQHAVEIQFCNGNGSCFN